MTPQLSCSGTKRGIIKFDDVKFSVGINNLSAYKSTGVFVVEKEEIYKIAPFLLAQSAPVQMVVTSPLFE